MHTSIRHYSLSVEREAARQRQPQAIVIDRQPSVLDRIRALLGGRTAAGAVR